MPATVVVIEDGTEVVSCLDARRPDLELVELLVGWQLAARRRGRRVRLQAVPAELRAVLELLGVDEVLGLEARRETELGEQLGEDEVVQPDDPPS